ncbi:hypothetical protein COCON_G00163450 [Conger conger]|uniref:Uncharacterized protein n=1 Tax=Conger conger TaxID=82655 RepID=A0A9Q1D6B9_CONCO|nr:hypothetical protein COCON_G00163450 [Conger conger]
MNLCLDNPYKDVTIPRAKLRASTNDTSTVIANPLALDSAQYTSKSNRNSTLNPYGNFKPSGEDPAGAGLDSQAGPDLSPPPYQDGLGINTVKEEDEEVGRCYTCCRRCRRKK